MSNNKGQLLQDPFLNAVAAVETALPAATLLARLHEIEAAELFHEVQNAHL